MFIACEDEEEAEKELSLIFSLILNFAIHDHKKISFAFQTDQLSSECSGQIHVWFSGLRDTFAISSSIFLYIRIAFYIKIMSL